MQEKKSEKITLKSLDARMNFFEESLRRIGVLLEEMNGKLSLLLEGFMGHDTRIVGLEDRMEKVERKADVFP
ncbi:MAG: hypothetical protein WCF77_01010 [Minisyncoccia bacterium]|jgi:hypothetical protein